MKRMLLTGIAAAVCLAGTAAAAATAPKVPDVPQSYLFTAPGKLTPLRAGFTYQASEFPLAARLTPPDRSWLGAQWKSGTDYFRGGGPPNFGWLHVGQG